ncbi:hypothetical protein K6119_18990 [Paracrocinitomix mangrovi]|uniref:hypothetical protein n=1 Tax=Paracrocinitomix mangrovi TaxID=2862509 RepID=UPI001C8DD596|nr:hypothetical protein [Paracrocinitomix mangrovi]UKN01812.1 hypothetical protein K6119_18990 [Paracrocinitomix mangrovi]
MRNLLIIFTLFISLHTQAQSTYNRLIQFNAGFSKVHLDNIRIQNAINDTSAQKFEILSWTPTISYTHEFALGQIISVSGSVGFQYLNIYYGPDYYGAPYFYISANPKVSLFYRKGFEYYIKLRVGGSFFIHHPDVIPEPTRNLLPERANFFTGVTLGGFNYFINDKIGLNLELSIWSPEMATFGLTYRFLKGEQPTLQNDKQDNELPYEQKTD